MSVRSELYSANATKEVALTQNNIYFVFVSQSAANPIDEKCRTDGKFELIISRTDVRAATHSRRTLIFTRQTRVLLINVMCVM